MGGLADTPDPPYYAVVFASEASADTVGYEAMAGRIVQLASEQPGFLGIESARGEDGIGITVSYWESEAAIAGWKANSEHRVAQELGRDRWYRDFRLRVARVERAYARVRPDRNGGVDNGR